MLRVNRNTMWLSLGFLLLIIIIISRTRHNLKMVIVSSGEKHFNALLNRILVPRWPYSEGHDEVCEFIVEELSRLDFAVLRDEISEPIPITSIIGITNPEAKRFLMLSCHYDTKFLEDGEYFVSATDAAVSCVILLNMANTLMSLPNKELFKRDGIGLVLAFFDGHDSLEGINDDTYPLFGSQNFVKLEIIPLKRINVMITLNLIGAPNHIYMSKYEHTYLLHEQMANIEQELRKSGLLRKCHQLFYKLKDHYSDKDDDHYPFFEAGVPVMHIVPHNYPEVWLKDNDNIENLHWPTIRNMNAIITRFVYDYFQGYNSSLL